MKIRVTLEVTDDARRCIAENMKRSPTAMPGAPYTETQSGMATRAVVITWLRLALRGAHVNYAPTPKVDALERDETRLAVEQLRAAGWKDSRIRSWLLKQAALMEGVKLELWEKPLLTVEKDGELPESRPTA